MAITKITAPSSIPATVADYQAQNSHLMAFINQINSQAFILSDPNGTVAPTIKQGAYISHGGSLYIVDTADATISGTPSDGTVYIRVSGTDTLAAEYITDISSYAWNSAYNAMISGSYTLLPYMLIKSGTSYTKYRFEQHKQSFGAIKVTSLDTGQGANELYAMNQNLRTIDSPEFANYKTATYTTAVDLNTIITNGHYYVAHGGANNPSATYCSLHVSGDSDVKSQTLIETTGKIWWRGGRLIGSGSDVWSAWKTIDQSLDTTSSPTFVNVHAKVNDAEFYTGGAKRGTRITKSGGTGAEWYSSLLSYLPNVGDRILVSGYITIDASSQRVIVSYIDRGSNDVTIFGINIDSGSGIVYFMSDGSNTFSGSIVL